MWMRMQMADGRWRLVDMSRAREGECCSRGSRARRLGVWAAQGLGRGRGGAYAWVSEYRGACRRVLIQELDVVEVFECVT
jgi:hypothetical protein